MKVDNRILWAGVVLIGLGVYWYYQSPVNPVKPSPLPVPEKRTRKILVIVQSGCYPCNQLKRDYASGFPFASEYMDVSQASKWKVNGTPTILALDSQDQEIQRKMGYKDRSELDQWLKELP